MPSQYAPDEPQALLWFEQVNYVAIVICAVAYGIHICVFFTCVYFLIRERRKSNIKWLIYVSVLFVCGTCNLAFNARFNQLAWIDERDYPGGPLAFLLEQQSLPIETAGNALAFLTTFLTNGLLIYRVYVVIKTWYILVIPILMWIASTVLSGFVAAQTALPDSSLWAQGTVDVGLPFWSISMALSALLTVILVARLMYMRHKIINNLGVHHGRMYSGVATMMVESGLPYGLVSFIFIVLYGIGNTAALLFIPLIAQVECFTPQLIMIRVSLGHAWSSETISEANLSRLRFGRNGRSRDILSNGLEGSGKTEIGETSEITFKVGDSNPQLRQKTSQNSDHV